jgi:hypothetical protein
MSKFNLKMYDNWFFAKELRFYSNHKSDVEENMLPPRLQTIAIVN